MPPSRQVFRYAPDPDEWASLDMFTKVDATRIQTRLKNICKKYFYFDFGFWDETFKLISKGGAAKKKVELVQNFKNKIRADIDPLFFSPTGCLAVFVKLISLDTHIPEDCLFFYRHKELIDALGGKTISEEALNARKKENVYYKDLTSKIYFYAGPQAHEFINKFRGSKKTVLSTNRIIKGQTANATGKKVKGRVRILIRDYSNPQILRKQMTNMQKGEILVSVTTDPELMLALRKASALVTDIGGLLSHSAIVSRELNIPCIIGTKIATKVLKDGDLVEVNADKGIVRKL